MTINIQAQDFFSEEKSYPPVYILKAEFGIAGKADFVSEEAYRSFNSYIINGHSENPKRHMLLVTFRNPDTEIIGSGISPLKKVKEIMDSSIPLLAYSFAQTGNSFERHAINFVRMLHPRLQTKYFQTREEVTPAVLAHLAIFKFNEHVVKEIVHFLSLPCDESPLAVL